MHLLSTSNPLSKSDGNIAVAVFSFKGRRKFLRVTEEYEDTIRNVRHAFNIGNALLSIHTTSLDACKGTSVEIDESAYPLMWTFLDEIDVAVEETTAEDEIREAPKIVEATGPLPTPRTTPPQEAVEELQAEEERPFSPPPDDIPFEVYEEPEYEYEEHIDEDAEREALLYAEEKAREEERERETGKEREREQAVTDPGLSWNFQDKPSTSTGDGSSQSPEKFRPVRNLFSQVKNDTPEAEVQVKKEKLVEPDNSSRGTPGPSTQSPRKGTADLEPRFDITVLGPVPQNHTVQFKTRGKHLVRKILAAACKTFELDYERAHLYLEVVTEENGEQQIDQFECPLDETMAQCGINAQSRLYVRVDDLEGANEDDLEDE